MRFDPEEAAENTVAEPAVNVSVGLPAADKPHHDSTLWCAFGAGVFVVLQVVCLIMLCNVGKDGSHGLIGLGMLLCSALTTALVGGLIIQLSMKE